MSALNQWWVWVVIIFVVLIFIWIYSRFTDKPPDQTKSKTIEIRTNHDKNTKNSSTSESSISESSLSETSISESRTKYSTMTKRKAEKRRVRKDVDREDTYSKNGSSQKSHIPNNVTKMIENSRKRDRTDINLYETRVPIVSSLSSTSSYITAPKLSKKMIIRHHTNEKKNKSKPRQSKGEAECLRVLEKLRKRKARIQVRDLDVLKNKITGDNLELDIYIENDVNVGKYKHLACEYHGRQHYEYVPFFHRNGKGDLDYQQWKDNEKVKMCDEAGIYLISVPYTVPINEIEDFIYWFLPENHYQREVISQVPSTNTLSKYR